MPDDHDILAILNEGHGPEVQATEWIDRLYRPDRFDLCGYPIREPHNEQSITTRHGTYAVHQNWLKPLHTLKRWRRD